MVTDPGRRQKNRTEGKVHRVLGLAAVLLCCANCSTTSGATAPPRARIIAGLYDGQPVDGGTLTWTLDQADTIVNGTGTYTAPGSALVAVTYAIRGIMRDDQLTVRLVGAPGDATNDSLMYNASFDAELYTAVVFDGTVTGGDGSLLAGPLQIIRRDSTPP